MQNCKPAFNNITCYSSASSSVNINGFLLYVMAVTFHLVLTWTLSWHCWWSSCRLHGSSLNLLLDIWDVKWFWSCSSTAGVRPQLHTHSSAIGRPTPFKLNCPTLGKSSRAVLPLLLILFYFIIIIFIYFNHSVLFPWTGWMTVEVNYPSGINEEL